MSNTQTALYVLALLSIYALAAALDRHAEQSAMRLMAQAHVVRCPHATSWRIAPLPAESSASVAQPAC